MCGMRLSRHYLGKMRAQNWGRIIINFLKQAACTVPTKYVGTVRYRCRSCNRETLKVIHFNFQVDAAAFELERSIFECRRAEVAFCVIGRGDAFLRDSHRVPIQFAVEAFVVECRDGVSAGRDIREYANRFAFLDCGFQARDGFFRISRKISGRGIERAVNRAFVAAQPGDLHVDLIFRLG